MQVGLHAREKMGCGTSSLDPRLTAEDVFEPLCTAYIHTSLSKNVDHFTYMLKMNHKKSSAIAPPLTN